MLVGIVLATRRSSKPTQRKAKKVRGAPITLSFITYLTIVVLLFFIPWGLNYLFAGAVTPQIRAWNRLVPILLWLFFCIPGVIDRGRL
jgi:peptidoglycan biosynthesis protein MviN/MurJ (putative lipid II flippase)